MGRRRRGLRDKRELGGVGYIYIYTGGRVGGADTHYLRSPRRKILPPPRPRPNRLPPTPPHTPRMHDAPICIHPDRTPAKPLVTNGTMSLLGNNNPPVQPPRDPAFHPSRAQSNRCFYFYFFDSAQSGGNPLLVEHRVSAPDAASEVGF